MTTQDPYGHMARDFMEMWQKQWSSVMSDKQFIHAMLDVLQSMQQGVYGAAGKTSHSHPSTASDNDERLAELGLRLAACEKRLAQLESAAAIRSKPVRNAKPRKAAKKPTKRSGKSRK